MTDQTTPNSPIVSELETQFPGSVTSVTDSYGMVAVHLKVEYLPKVVEYLKESAGYRFLVDLCGVHYPDQDQPKIGTVYQLMNLLKNQRIRLKVLVDDSSEPRIPSLTPYFSAANWLERETYDFFGIKFDGHPDLRRIVNEDSMTYFPLRKEYPLEDAKRTDKSDRMFGR